MMLDQEDKFKTATAMPRLAPPVIRNDAITFPGSFPVPPLPPPAHAPPPRSGASSFVAGANLGAKPAEPTFVKSFAPSSPEHPPPSRNGGAQISIPENDGYTPGSPVASPPSPPMVYPPTPQTPTSQSAFPTADDAADDGESLTEGSSLDKRIHPASPASDEEDPV